MKKFLPTAAAFLLALCCFNSSVSALPASTYPLSELVTYNGHSYAVVNYNTDWDTAKEYCEQMGGYLATVTSAEEEQAVSSLYIPGEFYYIGAYTDDHASWNWVTGETFDYSHWQPGEPNNWENANENVVVLNYFEGWNDCVKNADTKFVVEWNTTSVYPSTLKMLNGLFVNIKNGKTLQLNLEFPSGTIFTDVTWTTSNPSMATVDQHGVVTALKNGTVNITATALNGASATISVKITY